MSFDQDSSLLFSPSNQILGGTIKGLIFHSTDPSLDDLSFVDDVIETFPYAVSAADFLAAIRELVAERTEAFSDETRFARLIILLKKWIDGQFVRDFHGRPDFQQELAALVQRTVAPRSAGAASSLTSLVSSKKSEGSNKEIAVSGEAPSPRLPPTVAAFLSLLDVDPLEMARQLCLIEYAAFRRVETAEFLGQGWTKRDKALRSPNIMRVIERFNRVSMWVQTTVLAERDRIGRALVIRRLIHVATECRSLGNFNAVFEIMSGLNGSAVRRLKASFEALTEDDQARFASLNTLIAGDNNFNGYRSELMKHGMPAVPYLGTFMSDLTFTEDGNPAFRDHPDAPADARILNVTRCRMVCRILSAIKKYQDAVYNFTPVPVIQDLVSNSFYIDDEERLYKISLALEPRGADWSADTRRLRPETGWRASMSALAERSKRFQRSIGPTSAIDTHYVDDRFVVLGFPTKATAAKYDRFLRGAHDGHVKLYSFAAASDGDHSHLLDKYQYSRFAFEEHESPVLAQIRLFLANAANWLKADPANVIAAHCRGSRKSRTAVMACAWLIATDRCLSTSHATQHFWSSLDREVEFMPSQLRYIRYAEAMTRDSSIVLQAPSLIMESIAMSTMPRFLFKRGSARPFLSICRNNKQMFYSNTDTDVETAVAADNDVVFDCGGALISDDITLHFYMGSVTNPVFSVSFHTSFIRERTLKLFKRDIDRAHTDKACRHFPDNFRLTITFAEPPTDSRAALGDYADVSIDKVLQSPKHLELFSSAAPDQPLLDFYRAWSAFHRFAASYSSAQVQSAATALWTDHCKEQPQWMSDGTYEQLATNMATVPPPPATTLIAAAATVRDSVRRDDRTTATIGWFDPVAAEARRQLDGHVQSFATGDESGGFAELEAEQLVDCVPCAACGVVIEAGDTPVAVDGALFHFECTMCYKCDRVLTGATDSSIVVRDGHLFCTSCVHDLFVKCAGCQSIIENHRYRKLAHPTTGDLLRYHPGCYVCSDASCESHVVTLERGEGSAKTVYSLVCSDHSAAGRARNAALAAARDQGNKAAVEALEAEKEDADADAEERDHFARGAVDVFGEAEAEEELAAFVPAPPKFVPDLSADRKAALEDSLATYRRSKRAATEAREEAAAAEAARAAAAAAAAARAERERAAAAAAAEAERLAAERAAAEAAADRCAVCQLPIWSAQDTRLADGGTYHRACLACATCSKEVERYVVGPDKRIYCEADFFANFADRCMACSQIIDTVNSNVPAIVADQQRFHAACFKCFRCGKQMRQFARLGDQNNYCPECVGEARSILRGGGTVETAPSNKIAKLALSAALAAPSPVLSPRAGPADGALSPRTRGSRTPRSRGSRTPRSRRPPPSATAPSTADPGDARTLRKRPLLPAEVEKLHRIRDLCLSVIESTKEAVQRVTLTTKTTDATKGASVIGATRTLKRLKDEICTLDDLLPDEGVPPFVTPSLVSSSDPAEQVAAFATLARALADFVLARLHSLSLYLKESDVGDAADWKAGAKKMGLVKQLCVQMVGA